MAAPAPIRKPGKRSIAGADRLTGLMRGGEFEAQINSAIQYGGNGHWAVLVLGVDRFRHVNELLGYEAGDQALREMGLRLKAWAPMGAVVARLGGDEFGVMLGDCSWEQISLYGSQALDLLRQPVEVSERELFLSVSAGLSQYPKDGETAALLMRRASRAMARAKERGGNALDRPVQSKGLRPEDRYKMERGLRSA